MNMSKMTQEQISAFSDGELTGHDIDMALGALREPGMGADWDVYHQIGDVLRSKEMAITLSPDFSTRMAARLAAEPTIIGPLPNETTSSQVTPINVIAKFAPSRIIKRFALPGMIAATVATVALISTPQLMVAMKGSATTDSAVGMVASAHGNMSHVSTVSTNTSKIAASSSDIAEESVVLRDPRIDEYLLAHQRFSPSVYSTAQFARSATFATDSDK